MNKILLLGNTGQVGWELNRSLLTLGGLVALDFPEVNMADPASIRSIVQEHKPDLIINATAYTNVDKAESEPDLAMAINGTGPGILAEEARRLNAALIHYSTDYVFDGTKGEPYVEGDKPNPINVYGETKLAGERAVQEVGGSYLIFRTSWVYSLRRPCFVTKVLQWAKDNETLRIVDDQISSPTWSRTLAEATTQILVQGLSDPIHYIQENSGIYNMTDSGACSRYEWATLVIRYSQGDKETNKRILKAKTSEFKSAAAHPLVTPLDCTKLKQTFSIALPEWKDSLFLLFS